MANGYEDDRPGPNLAGRKLLVTGAASGIGRACVLLAGAAGAMVTGLDRDEAGLARLSGECGATGIAVDLRDIAATRKAVTDAIHAMHGVDGVVNCAGVSNLAPLADVSRELWSDTLAVNLTAPFVICQAAVPALRAARGSIVNVASGVALLPGGPGAAAYAASKGGLNALSKALAIELAPDVRVNTVCPGLTATPMTDPMLETDEAARDAVLGRYALRRAAAPEEIARVILFLISEDASYITGATVAADGGRTFH